jgi:hypothetical protein
VYAGVLALEILLDFFLDIEPSHHCFCPVSVLAIRCRDACLAMSVNASLTPLRDDCRSSTRLHLLATVRPRSPPSAKRSMSTTLATAAILFDFDGTLGDTETPAMEVAFWEIAPFLPGLPVGEPCSYMSLSEVGALSELYQPPHPKSYP